MKKLVVLAAVVFGMSLVSCEKTELNDELNSIEIQNTEQGDSVNTGSGGNDKPSNDED